jgi:hypothetical protein
MEITFNHTPEQVRADRERAKAWLRELPPEQYAKLRAEAAEPKPPAPPAPGPHASALSDAEAAAELRRLGVRYVRRG